MIARYSRPEMAGLWDPENRYRAWLLVEVLACEANAKLGLIPARSLAAIKKRADFDVKRIDALEKVVKHDVIAFLTAVGEHVGPDSRYIHLGLTSSDVLDTSLAYLMRRAADIIIADLTALRKVLRTKARQYKNTVMIGRSHGVHAEPVTFGLKMALWYEEIGRALERMARAREVISVGKVSGAVGTFANIDPSVERYVCRKLGLLPNTFRRSRSLRRRSKSSPSSSGTSSGPRSSRPRSTSPRVRRGRLPCRTSAIPSLRRTSPDWRVSSARTRSLRSRTLRSGTSAISAIRPSSGSSSRTARS